MKRCVGVLAVIGPLLHLVSDLMEWRNGGFTPSQLLINYAAFVMMPFLFIGLCAVQRELRWPCLCGAVACGIAFIYFSHTALYALEGDVPNYSLLLQALGFTYTGHGILMIAGGFLFAFPSIGYGMLDKRGLWLFVLGLFVNLIVAVLPLPEMTQIVGSSLRNIGLCLVGIALVRDPTDT